MQNPDFSAFVQRVKDANPEAVYIFVPGGGQPAAIGKALADRGLTPPATKVLAQGELTHPEALESMGETARGIITTYHYVLERDDPLNNAFVEGYRAANDGRSPDLFSIGGYDGMHLIYAALEKTGGDADGAALVEAAKGMAWESPRGPMSIDPETRDVIQTVYIREVQEVDGTLQNVIIHRDPRREGSAARRQRRLTRRARAGPSWPTSPSSSSTASPSGCCSSSCRWGCRSRSG